MSRIKKRVRRAWLRIANDPNVRDAAAFLASALGAVILAAVRRRP